VRRRLTAIIGVAFCVGALTALWAARPWERAVHSDPASARTGETLSTGAPVGAVGTYGESGERAEAAPLEAEPVPSLPPPSEPSAGTPRVTVPATGPRVNRAAEAATPLDLRTRRLMIPVKGVEGGDLQPTFHAKRGIGEHEALDVLAPKGTPVVAVDDGEIAKLFYSIRGGKTIYQFDRSGRYCYYYAHLDSYASGLAEKQQVGRGQVIGYVGTTGNADENAPHLHFAIFRLGPEKRWWQGTPIDPYPVLARE
jgi:peptidoglycan LD-endopeptidase LytH